MKENRTLESEGCGTHSVRDVMLSSICAQLKLAALVLVVYFAALYPLGLSSQVSPAAPGNPRSSAASQSKPQQASGASADPLAPLLAQAQAALDRNDFVAAIPLLQKIAEAKPNDALPHFELGFAYSGLKKNAEAIPEYRRAIALDPNLAPAQLNLGIALLDSDPAAAVEAFASTAKLLPSQVRPIYLMGEALERSGKRSQAIEQYRAALAIAPKDDAILFALARALLADKQVPAAESGFRELLAVKPDSAPAQLGLAESLLSERKTGEAVDVLRDYLVKSPDDRHARFERAAALQDLNRSDESLAELDKLDQLERPDPSASPSVEGLTLRGGIYMQQRKWSEAAAAFEKAMAASSNAQGDAQLHLWMGHSKMEMHDYEAAEKELRRARELAPANFDALRELVSVYYLSGQYEAAVSTLDLLAQHETPGALDWFFRALSCDKLGRKPEAAAAYQKFLEMDRGQRPDQEFQAQARLTLLLRELGRSPRK
jgi:tetratricopeptide (TPR) repeat protein